MENANNSVKLEITQDRLVGIFMHAVTREDIALARRSKSRDSGAAYCDKAGCGRSQRKNCGS